MRVLITGASSGIGRDMAREFAKRNYDLVIVARDTEKLEELKTELEFKHKIDVKVVSMDRRNRFRKRTKSYKNKCNSSSYFNKIIFKRYGRKK